jgi:hypothetical protein
MRYIRQRPWFVWLGLFALASQVVLTLGHVHAGRENGSGSAHFHVLSVQLEARDHAIRGAVLTRYHREMPADSTLLGGWCAYCWTIAQAASIVLPTPMRIRHGHLHQTLSPQYRTAVLPASDQASPFQSRGPPLMSQI